MPPLTAKPATEPGKRVAPERTAARLAFDLLLLAGFCAFFYFFGLGSMGLTGADEPRYAQIAREMLARHDWITPVLHGQPWLEKPVLYYWEAMISYSIFGVSDWAARLPAAIDATALVFATYYFARRLWRGLELTAALITASCAFLVGFGHAASTDMPLTASFGIGMLFWMAFDRDAGKRCPVASRRSKRWLAGFYFFMALGTLAKGPVALFLAGLIIVIVALLRRDARQVRRTLWLPGIVLFLAVALPWYVLVQLRTGNFFQFFILQQNLQRFGTPRYHHTQPFWYFAPILLAALLPWTALALAGLVRAIRNLRANAGGQVLVVWAVAPVVFFSFSDSKLPGYILPTLPAFALLAATYLYDKWTTGEAMPRAVLLVHGVVAGALLALVLLAPTLILRYGLSRQPLLAAITGGLVVFVLVMLGVRVAGWRSLRLVTLLPVILGLVFIVRFAAPALDSLFSARPVARELAQLRPQQSPIAMFNVPREAEYGLGFYQNQRMLRYERDPVPAQGHMLITHFVPEQDIRQRVAGRSFVLLVRYAPQQLDFYWVAPR